MKSRISEYIFEYIFPTRVSPFPFSTGARGGVQRVLRRAPALLQPPLPTRPPQRPSIDRVILRSMKRTSCHETTRRSAATCPPTPPNSAHTKKTASFSNGENKPPPRYPKIRFKDASSLSLSLSQVRAVRPASRGLARFAPFLSGVKDAPPSSLAYSGKHEFEHDRSAIQQTRLTPASQRAVFRIPRQAF